ncbi:bacillithiol system redox-active protein YtxJ [Persicitalea sp.]|uniref:bacillithiol system redox-active protein YtxJ n=1 Tax=Persicitalea sp. TaxID=3100273 RepID=UPI0035934DE3
MNWHQLTQTSQLEEIKEESQRHPVLIFKHSTRCNISATAKARFERKWKDEEAGGLAPYYLDLISLRSLSSEVADTFSVAHESPQVLLISKGECVYDASHFDISFDEISQQAGSIEFA